VVNGRSAYLWIKTKVAGQARLLDATSTAFPTNAIRSAPAADGEQVTEIEMARERLAWNASYTLAVGARRIPVVMRPTRRPGLPGLDGAPQLICPNEVSAPRPAPPAKAANAQPAPDKSKVVCPPESERLTPYARSCCPIAMVYWDGARCVQLSCGCYYDCKPPQCKKLWGTMARCEEAHHHCMSAPAH
jgi:hypothetical protein